MKKVWFLTAAWTITAICYLGVLFHKLIGRTGSVDQTNRVHRVASSWARWIIAVTPGWKVKIEGKDNLPPPGEPVVFIANHVSLTDIFVLYGLDTQFRWLAKDTVFKTPMVGDAMRGAGYVPVTRGRRESHQEAMNKSSWWLENATPMLFFPEGTRSKTAELKEFKSGAFRLARKHNVPIVPVCISGTRELMEKGTLNPGRATVTVKVLPAKKVGPDDIAREAAKFREMIANNR